MVYFQSKSPKSKLCRSAFMKANIVIPNINGKGWLKDSIESVYAQTEQIGRAHV